MPVVGSFAECVPSAEKPDFSAVASRSDAGSVHNRTRAGFYLSVAGHSSAPLPAARGRWTLARNLSHEPHHWGTTTTMPAKPFDLCMIVDDDEDVLLSARLVMRDLFAEVIAPARRATRSPRWARTGCPTSCCSTPISRAARPMAPRASPGSARMLEADPDAAIVMITAHGGVEIAVEAMKRGATDFVAKPWDNARLLATGAHRQPRCAARAGRAPGGRRADRAATAVPSWRGRRYSATRRRWRGCCRLIDKAGPTEADVLILGRERHRQGTGRARTAPTLAPRRRPARHR